MKQLSKPIRVNLLVFFMPVFFLFLSKNTAFSQTYCYEFQERMAGTKLEVDIFITASSNFKLGNTNFKFSYNPAALSLPAVIPYISALPNTYSSSVKSTTTGVVTVGLTFNGTSLNSRSITTGGTKIGTVIFDVVNLSINRDFALLNTGVKNTTLLRDDNLTLLVPSAQCPPSPYTSLFYDTNIELNADIPMNECVDSTTPGSTKLNFGDDETKEILPDGFKFKFYCEEVKSLKVGADGALLVNGSATDVLPNTNNANGLDNGGLRLLPRVIAPWWNEWRKGMARLIVW